MINGSIFLRLSAIVSSVPLAVSGLMRVAFFSVLLALFAASCRTVSVRPASEDRVHAKQEIVVMHGGVYEFFGETIYTFWFEPDGEPSGEVALYSVAEGKAEKIRSEAFVQMYDLSGVAVKLGEGGVLDIAFSGGAMTVFHSGGRVAVNQDAALVNTRRGGKAGPIPSDDQDYIFWIADRDNSEAQALGSYTCNTLEEAVALVDAEGLDRAFVVCLHLVSPTKQVGALRGVRPLLLPQASKRGN